MVNNLFKYSFNNVYFETLGNNIYTQQYLFLKLIIILFSNSKKIICLVF